MTRSWRGVLVHHDYCLSPLYQYKRNAIATFLDQVEAGRLFLLRGELSSGEGNIIKPSPAAEIGHTAETCAAWNKAELQTIGIDSAEMIAFYRIMEAQHSHDGAASSYLSTHPNTNDRIEKLSALAGAPTLHPVKLFSRDEWKDLRSLCRHANGVITSGFHGHDSVKFSLQD